MNPRSDRAAGAPARLPFGSVVAAMAYVGLLFVPAGVLIGTVGAEAYLVGATFAAVAVLVARRWLGRLAFVIALVFVLALSAGAVVQLAGVEAGGAVETSTTSSS